VRILTPTAKMIAQDQDFLVSHHLPLQILFPDPGYARIMDRNPAFQLKQRLASRDLFALGAQILAGNPIMMLFQGRDAGVMILIKMIDMTGRPAPRRSKCPIPTSATARRVANACAQASGRGGRAGSVHLTKKAASLSN